MYLLSEEFDVKNTVSDSDISMHSVNDMNTSEEALFSSPNHLGLRGISSSKDLLDTLNLMMNKITQLELRLNAQSSDHHLGANNDDHEQTNVRLPLLARLVMFSRQLGESLEEYKSIFDTQCLVEREAASKREMGSGSAMGINNMRGDMSSVRCENIESMDAALLALNTAKARLEWLKFEIQDLQLTPASQFTTASNGSVIHTVPSISYYSMASWILLRFGMLVAPGLIIALMINRFCL